MRGRSSVARRTVNGFGQTSKDLGSWEITQMGKTRPLGSEAIFTRLEKTVEKLGQVCGQQLGVQDPSMINKLRICASLRHAEE